ncbi:MAG: hypothetical protein IJ352_09325 [Muribaculaceae bacterium]|nr:hypothetical protein [Muribaculaceae bacterium]
MITTQTDNPNRSREGSLNPMYGKTHSQATKDKISHTQKKRYELIRKQLQKEDKEKSDKKINLLNLYIQQEKISTTQELEDAIYKLFQEERMNQLIEQIVNNYLIIENRV